MWKCKCCGSTNINCIAIGSFSAYGQVDEDGNIDKSTIDFGNINIYEDDLEENMFICEECRNNGFSIEEVADRVD